MATQLNLAEKASSLCSNAIQSLLTDVSCIFLNVTTFSVSQFIDNHDIISLKLYQLTVLRSQKEEEEEEEEITIPSVDNFELLRCKTHTFL